MADPEPSVQYRSRFRTTIQGLYVIADAGHGQDPVALVAAALAGGCRLIQLRCKGWDEGEVARAATESLRLTRSAGAALIINDHIRLTQELGADGVHLGQTDLSPAAARAILGEKFIIGVSHNTPDQLTASLPVADYVAIGPIFPTENMSIPKPVRGMSLIEQTIQRTDLPVVAIGGICAATIPGVRAAGASAWAVISAVRDAADPVQATRDLLRA